MLQNYNLPVLPLSNKGNNSYPDSPDWNIYNFGTNTSTRLLLRNLGFVVHPMHLHGHNFYILAAGAEWDGSTIVNPTNPIQRDTFLLPASSYAVIQFEADNPGTWPFHCHIVAHVGGGLYVNILERPYEIAKLKIPDTIEQTCRDYMNWQRDLMLWMRLILVFEPGNTLATDRQKFTPGPNTVIALGSLLTLSVL